ncbi:MAG: trypsin-like peptidase domain-containing protein [Eubacteriales bacterium]|nr:trypsin-like peptidase domain-containing protein [Eubacteriales bacterium]
MDDFKYDPTPSQNDDPHTPPQQSAAEQPAYGQQPAAEEPRTPYQTPVQHPAYQTPPQAEPRQPGYQPPQGSYPPPEGGAPQPPRKKKRGKAVAIGLCSVAAACLLFAGGAVVGQLAFRDDAQPGAAQPGDTPTMQIAALPDYDADHYDVVNGLAGEEIYKKVSPSIVSVLSSTERGMGSGSGVIMSADGYIITNQHVVEDAVQVTVQLSDGTRMEATIIGTDEQTDLAVIKVEPTTELVAAEFGDSDALQPGEYAYAIGSPGGVQFANTITGGRISAINRDVTINDRVMTLIQTDASINPGNSGGALINKFGQVVGITSAKLSSNMYNATTIEGMGFAIPVSTAKDIIDALIETGYVTGRPAIGISGKDVESVDGEIAGVQIHSIDSRAKAGDEGLQVGDVITAVDGTPTPTMDDVNSIKDGKKAGDKITLTVYRLSSRKLINVTVTLMDAHDLEGDDPAAQNEQSSQNGGYRYYSPFPFPFFSW